jgi:hypothetical protein
MNRSYGTALIAASSHHEQCADATRYRLAAQARPADSRRSVAHRVKPVLAYVRGALTALATVALGRDYA